MKKIVTIVLFSVMTLKSQDSIDIDFYKKYSNILLDNKSYRAAHEYAFMVEEFIDLTKKDTNYINSFKRSGYPTKESLYCYDVSVNFLKKRLKEAINDENREHVEKLISKLKTNEKPKKPNVDWGEIFSTCDECPFGVYPEQRFDYFYFSMIFMSEKEILQMIKDDKGKQWEYAIGGILGGDSFEPSRDPKYPDSILDRRMASYIIKRWEKNKNPKIQELINAYKKMM